ncbi:MAG: long-chain fatty acid--CoA ligase [Magnetococcales bacterium]|nr:long-chain fatty acid--CoA ligase [Magnetococcales bacterium]
MNLDIDFINPDNVSTLPMMFHERVQRSAETTAYQNYDNHAKRWRSYTWRETSDEVGRWQRALQQEEMEKGERVAIMLDNRWCWVLMDQAVLGLGLAVVSLYADDRPQSVGHILEDSGARVLIIRDIGVWNKLDEILKNSPALKRIICLHSASDSPEDPRFIYLNDWLPEGRYSHQAVSASTDDLATLIYTSGTTGRPKGVMLSHRNLLANAYGSLRKVSALRSDRFLSFLPLSHALERTAGYYLPMMAGAEVVFARSVATLAEDLQASKPTVIISVPRIYERLYIRIRERLNQGSFMARGLFRLAERVGWRRFRHQQGQVGWHPVFLLWPLLRRLVAQKILTGLGGRLRLAVSGGAAIPERVAKQFISLGVPLVQGYGLTESSPVICVNTLEDNDPTDVGTLLSDIEARIGDERELLVRGDTITSGYWQAPEATQRILDDEGWLHTGDQARFRKNGHLRITGRLKDIIVMANGRKIAPGDLESAIALDPLFEQVVVIGEGKPYLTALTVLDATLRQKMDPEGKDPNEDRTLRDQLITRINERLQLFPQFARIRRLTALTKPWTVDEGLITPTQKLRRERVIQHHHALVNRMYEGHTI